LVPTIFVNVTHNEEALKRSGLQVSLVAEMEAAEILLWQGTEQVKHRFDLMTKKPDQTSALGIDASTVKHQADADMRVISKDAVSRYEELSRQGQDHRFLKLAKGVLLPPVCHLEGHSVTV
jgi:hypothetical protein